jgi:hypothetical protein
MDKPWKQSRILHTDGDSSYYFYVSQYFDRLISFVHHNAINDDMCDCSAKAIGPHHEYSFCGYGGAVFTYTLEDGSVHKVRGPWSSGDYHYNEVVPEIDHVVHAIIQRDKSYSVSSNVPIVILLQLMKDTPYSLVRGLVPSDRPGYEIVHNDDVEDFIATNGRLPYERGGSKPPIPIKGSKTALNARWGGQTEESMKIARENAKVFVP